MTPTTRNFVIDGLLFRTAPRPGVVRTGQGARARGGGPGERGRSVGAAQPLRLLGPVPPRGQLVVARRRDRGHPRVLGPLSAGRDERDSWRSPPSTARRRGGARGFGAHPGSQFLVAPAARWPGRSWSYPPLRRLLRRRPARRTPPARRRRGPTKVHLPGVRTSEVGERAVVVAGGTTATFVGGWLNSWTADGWEILDRAR